MAVVLFNPTDRLEKKFQEIFFGHYMGKGIRIEPGKKIKVQDAAARHLLNELAPRGLVSLDYDDAGNEDEIAKEALARNRQFKVKQLNDFNQKNSQRKHTGLEYIWPTDTLRLYAEEIGVKMVESYQVDDAQLQKVKSLEDENKSLKEQMAEMNEKMNQILEQMTKPDPDTNGEIPLTKSGVPDKRFKGE